MKVMRALPLLAEVRGILGFGLFRLTSWVLALLWLGLKVLLSSVGLRAVSSVGLWYPRYDAMLVKILILENSQNLSVKINYDLTAISLSEVYVVKIQRCSILECTSCASEHRRSNLLSHSHNLEARG